MPEEEPFAIVMRMAGLRPENLIGYEFHRQRRGGDQSNIDPTRSHLNRRLIGAEDWASIALAEIREMQTENFANELASLKRRRRKTEMERRFAEGPRDPWVASRHGPMREIILTANRKWFEAAGPVGEAKFEELAREARVAGRFTEAKRTSCSIKLRPQTPPNLSSTGARTSPSVTSSTGRLVATPATALHWSSTSR